jgi:large subunit ribosomal protein L4e
MKSSVIDLLGKEVGQVTLPLVFQSKVRPDLIHRAYTIIRTHGVQPQGRDPSAGKKTSAETYNPPTGRGVARVPRVKGERYSRSGMAAGIASVVKGRAAHPPTSQKRIWRKINERERRLALSSAIAATASKEWVEKRGHKIENIKNFPLVVTDDLEETNKAKDLKTFFETSGLKTEIDRASKRKKNSGTARMRGRVTTRRKGPLIVVSDLRGIEKSASAFPGVDVRRVNRLSVLDLAPGSIPGRLAIWSQSAIKYLVGDGIEG